MSTDYQSLVEKSLCPWEPFVSPAYKFGEAYFRFNFEGFVFVHRLMIMLDARASRKEFKSSCIRKKGEGDVEGMWSVVDEKDWRWENLLTVMGLDLSLKEIKKTISEHSQSLLLERVQASSQLDYLSSDLFGFVRPAARAVIKKRNVFYSNLIFRSTRYPPRGELRKIENFYLVVDVDMGTGKKARAIYRIQKLYYQGNSRYELSSALVVCDSCWRREIQGKAIFGTTFLRGVKASFERRILSGSLSVEV